MKLKMTYQPGSSFLHVLHPLVKFFWLVLLTVLVFIYQAWIPHIVFLIGLLITFPLLGIGLGLLRGVRVLLITALMIALLQVLFVDMGKRLAQFGPVTVSALGVERGIYLGARFLIVVFLSYLFVLTTSPNDLAYALMQAGLPYRFGFTLVTALRLIPLFEEEALTVFRAQQVRGMSYDRHRLRHIVRDLKSLLLPMLVSAMSKVDALAISMEGRCFGMHATRTYYRGQPFKGLDWLALGGWFVVVSLSLLLLM